MSADNGGALVRSPPSVDPYAHQVGVTWEHQSNHSTPQKNHKPNQQNIPSVTKLPSGDRYLSKSNTLSAAKAQEKNNIETRYGQEIESRCHCGGWQRARQIDHDLKQLHFTHESILRGLFSQVDELKEKNRDLTFRLVMGPFASGVPINVPLSPDIDSDAYKTLKDLKTQDKFTSTPENERATAECSNTIRNSDTATENKAADKTTIEAFSIQRQNNNSHFKYPRPIRSLDHEILEKEAYDTKRQLQEEREKNQYLICVVEDLKRQLKEENVFRTPLCISRNKNIPKISSTKNNKLRESNRPGKSDTVEVSSDQIAANCSPSFHLPSIHTQTNEKDKIPQNMNSSKEGSLLLESSRHFSNAKECSYRETTRCNKMERLTPLPAIYHTQEIEKNSSMASDSSQILGYTKLEKDSNLQSLNENANSIKTNSKQQEKNKGKSCCSNKKTKRKTSSLSQSVCETREYSSPSENTLGLALCGSDPGSRCCSSEKNSQRLVKSENSGNTASVSGGKSYEANEPKLGEVRRNCRDGSLQEKQNQTPKDRKHIEGVSSNSSNSSGSSAPNKHKHRGKTSRRGSKQKNKGSNEQNNDQS